jgi:hypothetical protein
MVGNWISTLLVEDHAISDWWGCEDALEIQRLLFHIKAYRSTMEKISRYQLIVLRGLFLISVLFYYYRVEHGFRFVNFCGVFLHYGLRNSLAAAWFMSFMIYDLWYFTSWWHFLSDGLNSSAACGTRSRYKVESEWLEVEPGERREIWLRRTEPYIERALTKQIAACTGDRCTVSSLRRISFHGGQVWFSAGQGPNRP